jgi:hypothetical protein
MMDPMTVLIGLPLWSHDLFLIAASVDPVPEAREVTPGPWMAILVLGLVAASTLLWLSMRKHLRRIRVPGDDTSASGADAAARGSASAEPGPGETRNDRPADPPVS